jgi:hypothetical protein
VGAIHGVLAGAVSVFLLSFPLPHLLNPWLLWAGFPALPKPSPVNSLLIFASGVLVGTIASFGAVRAFLRQKWY